MKKADYPKQKAMTIREWWDEVGTENVMAITESVGTTFAYMRLLRYRAKRPGSDLALQIIAACEKLTPGFAPDLVLMIQPIKKNNNPNYTAVIQPSKAFLSAMSGAQK